MLSPVDKKFGSSRTGLARPALLTGLLLLAVLWGCAGYRLAADAPSVFGQGEKTLKVKGVDYPTLHPELPYRIRSILRDEITARHLAAWVDSGPADFEIQINVISYTSRQWMRDRLDRTVLYSTTMTLQAIVYEGSTNNVVWRSGSVSYSDSIEQAQTDVDPIIVQTIRELVDHMRNKF
jgi:hypothetical protein